MEGAATLTRAEAPSLKQEGKLRDLMVSYQDGDASAMEQLVEVLSPPLLRFVGGLDTPRADAEDLLQECWLRIHRARHTYRPSEPLLPWVYAIARHTKLDGYRRRVRQNRREVLVSDPPESPAAPAGVSKSPDVLSLLERLPQSQREVVLLLKVSGMSLAEVARVMDTSIGAVKQKAHRAYTALREWLAEGVEHEL